MVKITQNITLGQQAYLKKAAENRRVENRPAGPKPPVQDTVSISETSKEILQAGIAPSSAANAGERAGRVEELRQAVSEGRYTVDPEREAEKIISDIFGG